MTHAFRFVLSIALFVLTCVAGFRAASPSPARPFVPSSLQSSGVPEGPEKALFVRLCVDCHDAERTTSRRRTRAEWADTVRQMIEDGAEPTDEEVPVLIDFLLSNFGAVAINTAKAEDIAKVLGITSKDAEAIVAYRTAHGNFADFDAIKKVPGIDVARIEQKKESLRF